MCDLTSTQIAPATVAVETIRSATPSSILPNFDDVAFNRKLAGAARLSGPARYFAYGKLDADLARNGAPWAAYGNMLSHDFFSARMGCQINQPVYSIDLAALCIRTR